MPPPPAPLLRGPWTTLLWHGMLWFLLAKDQLDLREQLRTPHLISLVLWSSSFSVYTFSVFWEINPTKKFARLVTLVSCYVQVSRSFGGIQKNEQKPRMNLTPVSPPPHLTRSHEENWPHLSGLPGSADRVNPPKLGTPLLMWKQPRIKGSLYEKAGYPTEVGYPICVEPPTYMWTGPYRIV